MAAGFCILFHKHAKKSIKIPLGSFQFINVLLLFFDLMAWFYRGNSSTTGYYMVRIANFLVFTSNYLAIIIFAIYMCYCIPDSKRKIGKVCAGSVMLIGIVALVMLIISQFTHLYYYFDSENFYHRNEKTYFISMIFPTISFFIQYITLAKTWKHLEKNIQLIMAIYTLIPTITMILQYLCYGIAITNIGTTVSSLLVFIFFEIGESDKMVKEEIRLHDLETEILIAKIKPHFIFNMMSTLKYLIRINPKEAEDTIDELSKYFRNYVENINKSKLISAKKEIENTKNYITLEKMRFGDKLNVEYEINESDFMIPPFVLQPIVENAIKYGVTSKVNGGIIKISTSRIPKGFVINIEDDGNGFDVSEKKDDGRQHIGLENVRSRISVICNGYLEIRSEIGKGTCVSVIIPYDERKKRKNDNYSS